MNKSSFAKTDDISINVFRMKIAFLNKWEEKDYLEYDSFERDK